MQTVIYMRAAAGVILATGRREDSLTYRLNIDDELLSEPNLPGNVPPVVFNESKKNQTVDEMNMKTLFCVLFRKSGKKRKQQQGE